MKDFFIYFFGQGTETEFSIFTLPHFLPIAVMIAVIFLIRNNAEALRSWKHEENLR